MATAPFSARNRGAHRQIDNSFPNSARNGLLHLLIDLVEQEYVAGWTVVAMELQRIGRFQPTEYDKTKVPSVNKAKDDTEKALNSLGWDKVFDFCERLHNHLARATGHFWNDEFQERESKSQVQSYIAEELQRLFAEENLAFEFNQGMVRRRGRKHTVDVTTRAQVVLGDHQLDSARKHYEKALGFFRNPFKQDFENAVKEAVCAVEAAGKSLFPEAKASTLGDLTKWLSKNKSTSIPQALLQSINSIYAYRSGGEGIGHGGTNGGAASTEAAEYVLAVCASQIIYLVDISNAQNDEVPF